MQKILQPVAVEKLTPREQEILRLLAKGHYYREIGDSLDISLSTVRAHLHSVYKKLRVKSRTQAVCKFLGQEIELMPPKENWPVISSASKTTSHVGPTENRL